jgi:hypothetical protein
MTKRNQLIVGAIALVALVAAYWMLALSPKREEAARLGDEIAKVEQDLSQAQSQLAQYRVARDSYKSNYSTVARLGKAVPEEDDVRSLMVQLETAAERTKVDFRTIQIGDGAAGTAGAAPPAEGTAGAGEPTPPGATVGEAGFLTMPFAFKFEGKFLDLSSFMTNLERFVSVRNDNIDVTGRLLVLESLTLEPGEDGFPNIDANIGATSYLLPSTEGLTGGATPAGPSGAASAETASAALNPTPGSK